MRIKKTLSYLVVATSILTGLRATAADAPTFHLKGGDTVVFYGDSITEQNLYNQFVELYTVTRFPAMRMHFYGSGVGGDRVTGGAGGGIDERLARDVFPHKPTVVTVMLGMNDGSYRSTTEEIQSTYTKGYEHLLDSLRTNLPGVRITLLGPSPYDDVTRPVTFPGGYNGVMEHFGSLDQELASKHNDTFVSLNPLVVAALTKANGIDPLAAKLLLPDRVHPEMIAHWIMAESLLKGWNAPALVSSVTIDGQAGKAIDAQNATVDSVTLQGGVLNWSSLEKSLPLPFSASNASLAFLLQISDIQQQLNQEPLRVTGLKSGSYTLKIDTSTIGTFTADDLLKGINLADYETPMRGQAQRVSWSVRDRDMAHFVHMRMQMRKADTGEQSGKGDVLSAFENSLEDSIYETAMPKAHIFTLTPASVQ